MILIAEIILTVFVWRKGWKWLSLIPVGIAMLVGFLLGLSGVTELGNFAIFDVLAVVALIIMLLNKPNNQIATPNN